MSLDWLDAVESSVELGPMGERAVTTERCAAYQALLRDPEALRAHEEELVAIVRTGKTTGAVIYAALLLKALGRADLRELLEPYADDRRPCTIWPGGCDGMMGWLCESTRYVLGEYWSHPVRILSESLEQIERANWLELPSEDTMRAIRDSRRVNGRDHGVWVFRFAEMWDLPRPKLRLVRDLIEAMRSSAARVYGAMLLCQLDPEAGDAALEALANSNAKVDILERGTFGKRTRAIPMRDAVAICRDWSARFR